MLPALDRTATVASIVAAHGATARVFQRHDIDVRRGGHTTVLEACRERHLDPEEVFAQVEDAIIAAGGQARGSAPRQVPDAALVAHIVEHHHAQTRRAVPYIVPLLAKVAGRHGKRNRKLNALCDVGQQLADALEAYLDDEEREFLPTLLAGALDAVQRNAKKMVRQRWDLELLLQRVRSLADGYVVPEWGDHSYRVLMEELEALEEQVLEHLHLEDQVLVPRLLSRFPEAA
jgi:regulator of cell morphogenesis and NO signaling